MKLTLHVALISACPTEAQARDHLGTNDPYLGVWRLPEPYGGVVHIFGHTDTQQLENFGWTREDT